MGRVTKHQAGPKEKGRTTGPPQICQMSVDLEVESHTKVSHGVTAEGLTDEAAQ